MTTDDHTHPSPAHKAGCPVCNPDKTVPELNDAYRASNQRMSCIYRAGCPKPDVCKQVGHCTSMSREDVAYEAERDRLAAEYDRHTLRPVQTEVCPVCRTVHDKPLCPAPETRIEPRCPRPCNGRPDDFTMAQCILAGECGCTKAACDARAAPETEVTLEGLMSWGLRPLDHCAELSMRFISMDHAIAARELIRRRAGLLGGTAEKTSSDSARLDWALRNVSGLEWRRLGIEYSAGMTRDDLDKRIALDVPDEPLCDHGIPVHSPSACPSCHSSSPRSGDA